MSRDPLGDMAFLLNFVKDKSRLERKQYLLASLQPPYLFAENDPHSKYDPLGLAVDCKCAKEEGKKAADEAMKDNPYTDETANTRDALMHCYVGARLAAKCNHETATSAGIIKEVGDLLSGDPGDAEWRDIHNTKAGTNLCGNESTPEGAKSCCQQALDDGLLFPVPN